MTYQAAKEFEAIKVVHDALAPLEEEGRTRVLQYIASLLGINAKVVGGKAGTAAEEDPAEEGDENGAEEEVAKGAPTFSTFAELYDAAGPETNSEKALVVGYWLQVCLSAEHFTAAAANKELTHLGHKVANITAAIDDLKKQKPALALQLKKSGSSQQARKTYKVSHAGVKRVEEMIGG
jgi:hypothetical protein